jgi:hypothetical protein
MKFTLAAAAALLAAAASFAGTTYNFHNDTSDMLGNQQPAIEGTVAVDGPNMKMTITRGNEMVFKTGWIMLSRDGGKTIAVYDPAEKTVFEMRSDEMVSKLTDALESSGMKLTAGKPSVTSKDAGDGGVLEGFPTKKSLLDASIDLSMTMNDQSVSWKMSLHNESWTTDKLDAATLDIFQRPGLTRVDGLDKVIAAQTAGLKGRFPLKTVTTIHVSLGGSDVVAMTTTSTVTKVKQQALDASTFAVPAGYRRIDNPLAKR